MKEVLKSPSPDADQSPTSSVHLDHKTSLFHLSDSNTDSNELKASKGSGSSSDTQSFDEDSQGAFVPKKPTPAVTTVAPVKKKPGRKSAADKEADKSLSKILGTDGSGLEKDNMKVEVMLVDLAKKGPLGSMGIGKSGIVTGDKGKAGVGEKVNASTTPVMTAGRKTTGEKVGLPAVTGPGTKAEKGGKVGASETKGPQGKTIPTDPLAELRKKDSLDPLMDSDVYEFKEPESRTL